MFSLLILAITMILTAVAVRMGAIAFELSGLSAERAGFQALSCFTGVGFTTRESEMILATPGRRRIAVLLIRVGGAGVVATIAALSGALANRKDVEQELFVAHPELTLFIVAALLFLILSMMKVSPVRRFLDEVIARWVLRQNLSGSQSVDVLHTDAEGSLVVHANVDRNSPLLGRGIVDLQEQGAAVLLVERDGVVSQTLEADMRLQEDDRILIRARPDFVTEVTGGEDHGDRGEADGLLEIGSSAPEIRLLDQHGDAFVLSEKRGAAVILMFYVQNGSPLCSRLISEFEPFLQECQRARVLFAAVNPSTVEQHAAFAQSLGGDFVLLSDANRETAKVYQAMMFGGLRVDRAVYVIDPEGRIAWRKRGWPRASEVIAAAKAAAAED